MNAPFASAVGTSRGKMSTRRRTVFAIRHPSAFGDRVTPSRRATRDRDRIGERLELGGSEIHGSDVAYCIRCATAAMSMGCLPRDRLFLSPQRQPKREPRVPSTDIGPTEPEF